MFNKIEEHAADFMSTDQIQYIKLSPKNPGERPKLSSVTFRPVVNMITTIYVNSQGIIDKQFTVTLDMWDNVHTFQGRPLCW